ncbi:oxidoreductase-like protein [Coralloluteibacterium stylophorae]|uniref:Oxidoreductase-like protein n=1 Tax=Coralloluteibacterium stylophorae TaxID=1776034 RepID=A0AAP2FZG2_9GAMM|nr:oxidoreductase-like protein [Coralloluteibacterium stylophorae]
MPTSRRGRGDALRCAVHVSRADAPVPSPSDPRPEPPEQPLPSDCCESGCDPCIFDLHAEALAEYRAALAAWRARHPEAED